MESTATLYGLGAGLNVSIQALIDQGMQSQMPAWQQTALAQLASTQATLTADDRIDAVILGMSNSQSWNIDDNLIDGTNVALSSLMGSIGSMEELMSVGIALTETTTQAVDNGDGTVTVTTSVTHDPGVAEIMEQFDDYSATPASDAGAWLASYLSQGGSTATDNIAAFSEQLPTQIADYIRFALAGTAGGAYLSAGTSTDYGYSS